MDAASVTNTLCVAAAAGVFLVALADRLKVPSIALLLVGGVVLGPELLGVIDPSSLGRGLEVVVAIGVAVILFEGGLTLDVAGFRGEPRVITRMLTTGVLITWAAATLAARVFADLDWALAVMAGSLVIVTGPTVISPLLRRMNISTRLRQVLYWEAVLIDAVGVFAAVLCYELLESASGGAAAPLARFALRFAVGTGIGVAVGFGLTWILHRRWVGTEHANIVVLGGALLALGLANAILHEAGILSVITAGLVLSRHRPPELDRLKTFELELTELGIGILFVLLAAKLELQQFVEHGQALLGILGVLILLARPLGIINATRGQQFTWREKLFLSWMAPRGIVAASMASLFSLRLSNAGFPGAQFLETMTYAVIAATVLLQGLSAPAVARVLGLRRPSRGIWLLVGEPSSAVALHRVLRQVGARSLVIGTTPEDEDDDEIDHQHALIADPLAPHRIRDPRIADVEAVLAMTGSKELDERICLAWEDMVGAAECYRWSEGEGPGTPLAESLPQPAELAAGLEADAYSVDAIDAQPTDDLERFGDEDLRMILATENGRILPPGFELSDAVDHVVALRRRVPGLYGLIRDAIILDRSSLSFEDVVSELLSLAVRENETLDAEDKLAEILERELHMPSAIGRGVAVPHVYCTGVSESRAYVASIPRGLEMPSPDDQPVRLVFLIVSPAGQAQTHLLSLAAIARLADDRSLLRVVVRQRTRARVVTLLRERE